MATFENKDTAAKFETVGWVGGSKQIFGKFGKVDLAKVTPAQAESLVKRGFKKIRPISEKAVKPTDGKK